MVGKAIFNESEMALFSECTAEVCSKSCLTPPTLSERRFFAICPCSTVETTEELAK